MVENRASLAPAALAALEAEVADHHILVDVIRWGAASTPQRMVADIVVQDEFTHDVVLPYRDGLFLVYDTT